MRREKGRERGREGGESVAKKEEGGEGARS